MAKSKKLILIVEDDEVLSDIYVTKLELEGFETLLAAEGYKGIELAIRKEPDLILLDIVLPKMNGFDILKMLKKKDKVKDIPVIFLSNLGQDFEINKGLELGAVKYLVKSNYTPAQVVKVVKEVLRK